MADEAGTSGAGCGVWPVQGRLYRQPHSRHRREVLPSSANRRASTESHSTAAADAPTLPTFFFTRRAHQETIVAASQPQVTQDEIMTRLPVSVQLVISKFRLVFGMTIDLTEITRR